eukprot:scaffold224942_cov18-Prasinocladus_malaysianus.AAC.1
MHDMVTTVWMALQKVTFEASLEQNSELSLTHCKETCHLRHVYTVRSLCAKYVRAKTTACTP